MFPPLPEGFNGNVAALRHDQLEHMLYKTPTAGFKARNIILLVCYGIALIFVLVNVLVTRRIAHLKGGSGFWVYRVVNGYISLNFTLCAEVCGAACSAILMGYTACQFDTFQNHRGIQHTRPWRFFFLIPLVLSGFLITATSFQAYLVVATRRGRAWMPSPLVANLVFGVLLTLYTTSLLLVGALATRRWFSVESAFEATRQLLGEAATNWTPSTSLSAAETSYDLFVTRTDHLLRYQRAVIFLATAYATINMFLNVGALSLVLLIRRQVKSVELAGAAPTDAPFSIVSIPPQSSERMRQVKELKRVGMAQFNLSLFIVVLCVLWIPQTVFMGVWGLQNDMSWVRLEMSFYLIPWSFGPYAVIVILYFLYNQLQTLRQLKMDLASGVHSRSSISGHGHRLSTVSGPVSGIMVMVERQTDEEKDEEELYSDQRRPSRVRVDFAKARIEDSPQMEQSP